VYRKICGLIWALRNKLVTNSSRKWLLAMLAAVLPEIDIGIQIPKNPADRFDLILGGKDGFSQHCKSALKDRSRCKAVFESHAYFMNLFPWWVVEAGSKRR
jgi:hypothetical protein